ncbi:EamA family transporter [Aquitalea sp. LB_tupeE]|nr:EamA family transporter [Aquitalea sp. LB_tupeE]
MHLTETGGAVTSNQGSRNMVMAGLLLGTLGIFVSEANQPPLLTVFMRCLFGALALLVWGGYSGKLRELHLRGRSLVAVLLASALMVSNWGLFFAAIPRTTIGLATVLFHLQPFWVMLYGSLRLGETLSRRHLLAAITALLGLALACGMAGLSSTVIPDGFWGGVLMCIGGSLSYAGLPIIARQQPNISSFAFAWWQCAVGVVLTAWWPLLNGWPTTASSWAWLAGLGSLHTGLAYALLYSGMSQISISRFAVLQFVYPVTAIVVDWQVYHHALDHWQLCGIGLMGLALWSLRRFKVD